MKKVLALLLALVLPALSACSGPLTARRRRAACDAGQARWTGEFVFLGLAILNVYTVSALADAVVLNTREFWSGHDPVAPPPRTTRGFSRGEAVASLTFDPAVPSIRLAQRFADGPERVLELRPIREGVVGLDGTGRIILYSRRVDGRIIVTDNEANFIRVYEREEAARLGQPTGVASAR